MINSKDLEERLEKLGLKVFHLAKLVAEIRRNRGNITSPIRLNSAIAKAIDNPTKSGLETLEDIVTALGGEIKIVWNEKKVLNVLLTDELIEVLLLKASTSGYTPEEFAAQLLQKYLQASFVSANSSRNTKGENPGLRGFHPQMAEAYIAVHEWLTQRQEANGYKQLDYSRDIVRALDQTNLQLAAFQYHALFPKNYFKVAHILDNEIVSARLVNYLKYNPHICIVDMGCGAGAASAAFIEAVLTLCQRENLSKSIKISCLGVDTSIYGITLYTQLMQQIRDNISSEKIEIEFKPVYEGIPKAAIPIMRYLKNKIKEWQQPCLSNIWVIQTNLISSVSEMQKVKQQNIEELTHLGVSPDLLMEDDGGFGQDEALAYKQLIESVPIDSMSIITIGTKNLEKRILEFGSNKSFVENIQDIDNSINQVFGNSHRIERVIEGLYKVCYKNPISSYWRTNNLENYCSEFYAIYSTITNANLEKDDDWNSVTSITNLESAWAKVRYNLLAKESFYDEIEIRLFEKNLDVNLTFLQQQLIAYTEHIAHTDQQIYYPFPKSELTIRPKELSRLEDEILVTAIIEKLGKDKLSKLEGCSYAYRLEKSHYGQNTEYLYKSWFYEYERFINDARTSAQQYSKAKVIKTDIQSYYTQIVQNELIEEVEEKLAVRSERVKWLLRILLLKGINQHEIGHGLTQGNIGSGFWANIYLLSIDARFSCDKRVKFYRYLDDMIFVVIDPKDVDNVINDLEKELRDINLQINKSKTEIYDVDQFIADTKKDEKLNQLDKTFKELINLLWICNSEYRSRFEAAYNNNDWWWCLIERYKNSLQSINIYVTEAYLSRKVSRYLFNSERRSNELKEQLELKLPPFPSSENFIVVQNWAKEFLEYESEWMKKTKKLRIELVTLFRESWLKLQQSRKDDRELQRNIRFAINKLSLLGFNDLYSEIVEIFCNKPFIIREPLHILESIASQGYVRAIRTILEHYYINNDQEFSEYIRAISLQALRFVPNINVRDWELIVESATEVDSIAEKLKATETWLHLANKAKLLTKPQHIEAVEKSLESDPPNRLKKNYYLILGLYNKKNVLEVQENTNDYLLRETLTLALLDQVTDLFEEHEPQIIREKYYNAKMSNDVDESENKY